MIDPEDCKNLEAPLFECGPGHFTQGYGWLGGIYKNYHEKMTDKIVNDWRYNEDKMKVRQQALFILNEKYGKDLDTTRKSKYTNQSIYECAHDWVSQGNVSCSGITKYYEAYYAKSF